MPRHPLLPILRTGSVLLLSVVLLYRPRRAPTERFREVPGLYVVDVRADAEPLPIGGRLVPSAPFPGQVVPDAKGRCPDADDVVLSGGCWVQLVKRPRPVVGCDERGYKHGDACYAPVMKAPRMPSTLGE